MSDLCSVSKIITKELEDRHTLLIAVKGALAALSQNKNLPADIVAAKRFLNQALETVEER